MFWVIWKNYLELENLSEVAVWQVTLNVKFLQSTQLTWHTVSFLKDNRTWSMLSGWVKALSAAAAVKLATFGSHCIILSPFFLGESHTALQYFNTILEVFMLLFAFASFLWNLLSYGSLDSIMSCDDAQFCSDSFISIIHFYLLKFTCSKYVYIAKAGKFDNEIYGSSTAGER